MFQKGEFASGSWMLNYSNSSSDQTEWDNTCPPQDAISPHLRWINIHSCPPALALPLSLSLSPSLCLSLSLSLSLIRWEERWIWRWETCGSGKYGGEPFFPKAQGPNFLQFHQEVRCSLTLTIHSEGSVWLCDRWECTVRGWPTYSTFKLLVFSRYKWAAQIWMAWEGGSIRIFRENLVWTDIWVFKWTLVRKFWQLKTVDSWNRKHVGFFMLWNGYWAFELNWATEMSFIDSRLDDLSPSRRLNFRVVCYLVFLDR